MLSCFRADLTHEHSPVSKKSAVPVVALREWYQRTNRRSLNHRSLHLLVLDSIPHLLLDRSVQICEGRMEELDDVEKAKLNQRKFCERRQQTRSPRKVRKLEQHRGS